MKEYRQILFRGAVHASTKGIFHSVWPAPQVSLATFATRFRRLVLAGSFDEQGIEEALMLDVPSFRRKYGVRKTFAEIDGQRVDLHALFSAQPGEVRVKYSIARQRCRSLQRLGPLSMISVEDAFRLNGAGWKTAYGGGRHKAFVYAGREFPELIGKDFHGISAFLLAIGRYGDRALVWGRMKAGWSLDSALMVPSAHPTSARTGTIYRVTRFRTGQFYIGLTVCYVGQRWAFHVRAAKAGQATKFAAAVRADGPEGFVVDVLEQGIVGSEKLAEREKYWAEKLGSFGDMGLNTAPAGGLGGPRGISTKVNGEVFVSKNEAAQVLGARYGIAPHVVRSRLVQGQPVPDPSSVRKHSPHPEAGGNLFRRWLALLRRHPSAVVSRWLSSYDDFKADVSPAPGGHALVRKNDLNPWGPSNFEWLNNQARVERSHGTAVSVLGIPYPSLTAVSTIFGIGVSTLKNRIYRQGMSIDDAVRRPLSVTSYRRFGAEILIDNQTFRSKRQAVHYLATTRGWTENQAKYRFSIGAYGHRL